MKNGHFTLATERTEQTGHIDHWPALALKAKLEVQEVQSFVCVSALGVVAFSRLRGQRTVD